MSSCLYFDNARVARYKIKDSVSMLLKALCRVLYQKSASLDIADDQMLPNLILKLSLANVGITHSRMSFCAFNARVTRFKVEDFVEARLGDQERDESPCLPSITSVCIRKLALGGIGG